MKRQGLLTALLMLIAGAAHAQQANTGQGGLPPLNAERGGFTNGTVTIEPRHFETEIGYLYLRADHTHTSRIADNSVARYGLRSNVEFRVGLPAYQITRNSGQDDKGWDDANFGVKWRFLEEQNSRPALALIATTALPTSTNGVGSHYFDPQVSLETSKDLGPHYSLEADVVYARKHEDTQAYDQWSTGIFLARHLTRQLDVFAETYRQGPDGEGTPNTGFAGGGITYLLNRDTVYDLQIDNGIFRVNRENFFISTGISHRF